MSVEDPRETLKKLLLAEVQLKRDDDSEAKVGVLDEFNEEFWADYDLILTVALAPGGREKTLTLQLIRHVIANYRVGIWTRNREGLIGRRVLWDAEREVKRVIGKYSKSPGGILKFMKIIGVTESHRLEPKPMLFHADLIVETHRFASQEGP